MTIVENTESDDYYRFVLSDDSICKVGKQSNENTNGAANYEEAIEILRMNYPDLEL